MKAQDVLSSAYQTSDTVLRTYVSDLSDADLLHRPGNGCNHLAWQLGHLIASDVSLLNSVCPNAAATLPDGFAERYSKATASLDAPSAFDTKAEYLRLMDLNKAAALAAFSSVSEERLSEPGPAQFQPMFPTVGSVLLLVATHGLMHSGQFVPVRRSLGKPILI
jgi:uncharacterized damage-inducible protein DinB